MMGAGWRELAAAAAILAAVNNQRGVPHPALSANTVISATRHPLHVGRSDAIATVTRLPLAHTHLPHDEHIPLPRRPLPPRLHPHPPPQNPDNQVMPRHILQVTAPLPHRIPHPLCRPLHPSPRLRLQHSHEALLHRLNSLHPLPHEVQVQVRPLCPPTYPHVPALTIPQTDTRRIP